ncbi:MAG TPA: undecaprenyldiphospho-muramoylpentapeptide beta-N-acetylglucosaminyltransferase [Gallionellaceae bacterium]|nr:undecaprenyldiphospho-muramoylpentapeptide beta-N-acetylglucosaminyltransferase [Gallionellaceae bacterium]
MSKQKTVLVMAGGTGGHIFPGLAVADYMKAQGWRVVWLGAPHSMESELVPKHGYPIGFVDFYGMRGKGLWRKLTTPFSLLFALWQSLFIYLQYRPSVVLGMGGYITVPGGLMAFLLRRPLVIHEQNAVAGMSNKLLARYAKRVMSGFPDVLPNAEWCGNPVRASITALPDPAQRYAGRDGNLNLLVIGGSLGAKVINERMPKALALIAPETRPHVLHQSGKLHYDATYDAYAAAGVDAMVAPFVDDMAFYYDQADLVVCRAGALTVSELAAAGVASILVPFPHAVDDHQTVNARFLSERGAAVLLPQDQMTPERLAELLRGMTRERAVEMARAARAAAQPESARKVAEACMAVAK